MIAFACEPGRGSEPGVGFAFTLALANHARQTGRRATVLTRPHRIAEIREALAVEGLEPFVDLVAVKVPLWFVRLTFKNRRWVYILWQARAVLALRALLRGDREKVIVHHVTFASDSLPTFEFLLPRNVIRIFGPAGSSQVLNHGLSDGRFARIRMWIRDSIRSTNLSGARLLIAQNSHVAQDWNKFSGLVITEPNIVVSKVDRDAALASSISQPGQAVSVGLLIERKRHKLAIDAFAGLADRTTRLTIIGGGPMEGELRTHVLNIGLEDRINFTGWLSREETLAEIAGARVLILASRQEGAGWVVGEAQSLGTTPVVISGSGSDTIVELGGGVISADSSVATVSESLRKAFQTEILPSDRWSEERLSQFLFDCYALCD